MGLSRLMSERPKRPADYSKYPIIASKMSENSIRAAIIMILVQAGEGFDTPKQVNLLKQPPQANLKRIFLRK